MVYGSAFHNIGLLVEEEREYEVLVPGPMMPFGDSGPPTAPPEGPLVGPSDNPFAPPGAGGPPQQAPPEQNPFQPPPEPSSELQALIPPGMVSKKINERVILDESKPEWVVVRDVTFGGVARLANGQLKRTYSGKPPTLCPT